MPHPEQVTSITTVPEPASVDRDRRTRQYLAMMGLRTLCFVLAYFAEGWLRWTCVVLAVVLPYIAVVVANAVRPQVDTAVAPVPRDQLTR